MKTQVLQKTQILHEYSEVNMRERFFELWNKLDARNPDKEYTLLQNLYSDGKRYYHNMLHVHKVLTEFDYVKHLAENPMALELAIFYHDAIYDPMQNDNEEESARLLARSGVRSAIDIKIIDKAYLLVMATKHESPPLTIDEKIITDCDISSLGKSDREFDEQNYDVWQEYSFLPKDIFFQRRKQLLQQFLDKPSIYQTDFFRKKYEVQAQKNIRRAIVNLEREILFNYT